MIINITIDGYINNHFKPSYNHLKFRMIDLY